MLKTERLVIVEGKYDKIKLERIMDALIITTDGFSVFKASRASASNVSSVPGNFNSGFSIASRCRKKPRFLSSL